MRKKRRMKSPFDEPAIGYGRSTNKRKPRKHAPFVNFSKPEKPMTDDSAKDGRTYYYIYVKPRMKGERPVFDGPYPTEQAALDFAYANMADQRFRIIASDYRDPARATREFKHGRLTEEGIKLQEAIMPVKHKI